MILQRIYAEFKVGYRRDNRSPLNPRAKMQVSRWVRVTSDKLQAPATLDSIDALTYSPTIAVPGA